jgi:hypothetical protein
MFYANGDDRLRCQETLSDSKIRFIVNSEMLFKYLTEGPEPLHNLREKACWFEPAFPVVAIPHAPRMVKSERRNFFFYARPNNLRNLFWYGLDAIVECIEEGILVPEEWDFHFAGRDLFEMTLPGGVRPTLHQNIPWPQYIALTRTIDVGLSLMATPHPSYPPLDLAAAGAIVVTNRYATKVSLSQYSDNIICVSPTIAEIKQGIAAAVRRSFDPDRPKGHDRIKRSWDESFKPVLQHLFEKPTEG